MGKKELLARLLYYSGLWRILIWVDHHFAKSLVILAYHRVLPDVEQDFPGDIELVSATTADFDWQMGFLARHCRVISFKRLPSILSGQERKVKSVIVTFDDGFIDNYEHAAPILLGHGLPATIFISAGYMGKAKTFWFERLVELLRHTVGMRLRLESIDVTLQVENQHESLRQEVYRLLKVLKKVPNERRLMALEELEVQAGHPVLRVDDISRPMTWPEIRKLKEQGLEIGSHSWSHPILSHCSDESLDKEILGSREEIQNQVDECEVMSYPVGGEEAYDQRVIDRVKKAGYSFACTYVSGGNDLRAIDGLRLKRIHVERYTSRAMFVAALIFPTIFR